MAERYDFQIGSLKFRSAASDQFPYVRATAPFRKEQSDTTQNPGDQSLTGWWTRAQLSFHRGMGIDYYEVTEGPEILERFKTCESVNISEAGEVTLASDHDGNNITITTAGTGKARTLAFGGTSVYSVATDGEFYDNATVKQGTVPADFVRWCSDGILSGQAYISVSNRIERYDGTTAFTVAKTITNASGDIFEFFWAKHRWWVFDNGNQLLTVPGDGAISTAGLVVHGSLGSIEANIGSERHSLIETPGPVYMAIRQYIFAIEVDDASGTVSSPVVVADLGPGTNIMAIGHSRGRIGIITTNGFQVAEILPDGSLVVGPKYIDFDISHCRTIACMEDRMYIAGVLPQDAGTQNHSIIEVDVHNDVSELEPAWSIRQRTNPLVGVNSVQTGVSLFPGRFSFNFDYIAVQADAATAYRAVRTKRGAVLDSTGFVTTAQHRLGTLEPKQFFSIKVNAEITASSTGQQIQVYRVAADGTETSLGTITANGITSTTFSLSGTSPTESMGFKFALTRGSTTTSTPKLLGYQIKALPFPDRQRLLRWPLAIQDVNLLRRGSAAGRKGKAWSDLDALEDLERAQALVTFTDHRTGETGTAYVDDVEFQGDTPSTSTTHGFGGVAYVTLRVVS